MNIIDKVLSRSEFEQKPPVLIDIGASKKLNESWRAFSRYSICLAFDADNRDFSFTEAETENYRKLFTFNCIVTDSEDEKKDFYLTKSPYCSSILPSNTEPLKQWAFAELFDPEKKVQINNISLVSALKKSGIDYIDWFKTDSQGIDVKLFKSLPENIQNSVLVAEFEPGIGDAYIDEDKVLHLLPYMEPRPFAMTRMNVKGTKWISQELIKSLSESDYQKLDAVQKTCPYWAEITYINNFTRAENFTVRQYLLAAIFAIVEQEYGFCLKLCRDGYSRFNEEIFKEIETYIWEEVVEGEQRRREQFASGYYEKLNAGVIKRTPVKPAKQKPENILYINTLAGRGGASKAAYNNLCKPLRERKNYNTKMLVKQKFPNVHDENVQLSPRNTSDEQKILIDMHNKLGWLYFFNLGAFEIKDTEFFTQADIVHYHNLHGGYFSPFALPELTALKPAVWTLHDEQSYTGHCSYSFECEKWQSGCGNCPDLEYYPAISADTTDFLLKTKKHIYDNSHITYVCPSNWLKDRASKGILKDKDIRVIPNGIDEKVFCPRDKQSVRKELNLPPDRKILMFSADHSVENPQKGGYYIKQAYEHFKNRNDLLFLAIGGEHTAYTESNFLNVSYIFDENLLAKHYAASDLFIYPSLSETFGLVVAEAMSCRTPVVAFGNSALPELVSHMETGYLAQYKDTDDFIKGINLFLEDDELRKTASIKARESIERKFTIDISINNYEKLYAEIWENAKK